MTTSFRVNKSDVPNVDSYTSPVSVLEEEDLFTEEDENTSSASSAIIQKGWAAAKAATSKESKFATDFKFDEDVQLVKFISDEPLVFKQHWVNRAGKKSFIALGDSDPLTEIGSVPVQKFAFTVLNLSDEEPQLQLMIVGKRLCAQLEKFASDKKTGPLNRSDIYYAVSKSGSGTKTTHTVVPVKERDLAEEWDLDPIAIADYVKTLKPYGTEALYTSTKAELAEVAREVAGNN